MTSRKPIVLPLIIKVVISSKITVIGISLGLSLLVAGLLWHRKRKDTGNLSSPENEPTLSKVEINFLRIANLLTTICPSAVRVYFDKLIPPNELKTFLDLEKNNKILVKLQERRIIMQVQWKLLFPSDGTEPSSSTFGVTLMVTILRNLKGMIVYDGPPSTYKNLTESTAVSRIKYYRNQIVHSSTRHLSDNEFNIIFDEIVEAIEKLSPSMKSECDLLRIRELDRSFIEVIQEFIYKEKEYLALMKEQELRFIASKQGNLSPPENEPTSSKDKVEINFLRIANLLTTICSSAVRVYFDKQIPPNELKTFLDLDKNNKMLVSLRKRCIITQVQWELLFPSDGTEPSSSTFGVTLMVTILRNLTGMTVHDGPPSTYKNLTESTAVSRIKYYRNQIVHSSTRHLSDNEFNIIFDEIVEAIEKLSPSMKSECDLLRIRELDRSFIEVIQEFIYKEKEYLALMKEQELRFIASKQDKIKEEEDKTIVKQNKGGRGQTNVKYQDDTKRKPWR